MKKALLFPFLVFSAVSFAQTVANTAPDLQFCDPTVMMGDQPDFNLTEQTAIILGDQDPALFTVTYFDGDDIAPGWSDPETNTNPIEDPEAYSGGIAPNPATIFARVTNNEDNTYAITSFEIELITVVSLVETVVYCDGYHTPYHNIGNLYTEPGGTGTMFEQNMVFTEPPGMLYFYADYKGCIIEGEVNIMHNFYPFSGPLEPLVACDENMDGFAYFDLTSIIPSITEGVWNNEVTFHQTYDDAVSNLNQIENLNEYPAPPTMESIYIRKTDGTCESVTSMDLIVIACEGNSFSGTVSVDAGENGCTESAMPAEDVPLTCNGDGYTFYTNTSANGDYTFLSIPEGSNTVSVQSPAYIPYATTPEMIEANVSENSTGNNFCITGSEGDNLSLLLLPAGVARPGFESNYFLKLRNEGGNNITGTITLTFDDSLLDFVSTDSDVQQSGNVLSFDYDISGLQSEYINLVFLVMQPPTTNDGDFLDFTAALENVDDLVSEDNFSLLEQVVVNSLDPNDITVHEGDAITPEQTDDYLHYTIRFQNVGTASAIHVRIEGMLDDKLDWDTFQPLASSHVYQISREGNELEFRYNNINLPDSLSNEPGSHGFITYRIKPKPTVVVNDVISASANIFFDFNSPVATNIVTTTVQETAGIEGKELHLFTMHPNPADDFVSIELNDEASGPFEIRLVDVLGKTVLSEIVTESITGFSVSHLERGIYFITIANGNNNTTRKLVIK